MRNRSERTILIVCVLTPPYGANKRCYEIPYGRLGVTVTVTVTAKA